jgi:hypothetical protein
MERGSNQALFDVLDTHNKLRTDPAYIIPKLEEFCKKIEGKKVLMKENLYLLTKEGKKAVEEAIKFLK